MFGKLVGPDIVNMIENREFAAVQASLMALTPPTVAEIFSDMSPEHVAVVFRVLPRRVAADVFEYCPFEVQEAVLRSLGTEQVAAVLNEMAPDDRTALLEELPAAATKRLLELLSPEERRIATKLLGYPPKSVGRRMTPDYVAVSPDWTVAQVMEHVRRVGRDKETLNVIYVVDQKGLLIDDIRLRELVLFDPTVALSEKMDRQFFALRADQDQEEAVKASSELAKTRGAYPNYIGSPWQKRGIPVRNAHLSSLGWDPLPSLMAQVSPGIEPHSVLVALAPESNGRPQFLVHPFLADIAGRRDFLNEQTLRKTVEAGSLHRVPEIPEDIRKVFVTAEDIDWEWHLRMAYAFEKYFDHGVAKICPVDPRLEDEPLRAILEQAGNLGLKSLWMKRSGDLNLELSDKAPEEAAVSVSDRKEGVLTLEARKTLTPRERPERLKGTTHKFKTCCGNLYVTINEDERGPFELFAQLGKSTGCSPAQNEMISRLISLALRSGVASLAVLDQLQGLGCAGNQTGRKEETPSCTEAIALALSFSQNDRKLAAAEPPAHGLEKLVFQNKTPAPPPPALPESLELAYFQEGFGGTKARCTECGSPFEKLNGSSLCPDCKKK